MKKNKQIVLEKLNRKELYRYLGYKSGAVPDDVVSQIIDNNENILLRQIHPAYIWNVFNISELSDNGNYVGISFTDTNLILKGLSIKKHLSGCSKAAILCATLSGEADKLIRQTEKRDMAEALIVDTLSSVAIEQVCDMAEDEIKSIYSQNYLTYRFGVGYGDLSLEHEYMILDIMQAGKHIGLSCTDSNILVPRKSVVCIIGLSDNPLPVGQKGCITCNMKNKCDYRKEGLSCSY